MALLAPDDVASRAVDAPRGSVLPGAVVVRDALDLAAKAPHGPALGGLILLHGRYPEMPGRTSSNGTDGRVAMRNAELEELLGLFTRDERPVLRIDP